MARARDKLSPRASYEGDFYAWAIEQAALLRAQRFAEFDVENPGLTRRQAERFQRAHRIARDDASRETGISPSAFPDTLAQASDWDFWPGGPWPQGEPRD